VVLSPLATEVTIIMGREIDPAGVLGDSFKKTLVCENKKTLVCENKKTLLGKNSCHRAECCETTGFS
jgi:hypothetical protein